MLDGVASSALVLESLVQEVVGGCEVADMIVVSIVLIKGFENMLFLFETLFIGFPLRLLRCILNILNKHIAVIFTLNSRLLSLESVKVLRSTLHLVEAALRAQSRGTSILICQRHSPFICFF